MSRSIISNEKKCWMCGTTRNLHRHHIFHGVANRPLSEKYGCWVYLCGFHHNLSEYGVHFDKEMDTVLKKLAQKRWEDEFGIRKEFIETFGRNYLGGD